MCVCDEFTFAQCGLSAFSNSPDGIVPNVSYHAPDANSRDQQQQIHRVDWEPSSLSLSECSGCNALFPSHVLASIVIWFVAPLACLLVFSCVHACVGVCVCVFCSCQKTLPLSSYFRMSGLFQTTFYFVYMALFCLGLGIMCGKSCGAGFRACVCVLLCYRRVCPLHRSWYSFPPERGVCVHFLLLFSAPILISLTFTTPSHNYSFRPIMQLFLLSLLVDWSVRCGHRCVSLIHRLRLVRAPLVLCCSWTVYLLMWWYPTRRTTQCRCLRISSCVSGIWNIWNREVQICHLKTHTQIHTAVQWQIVPSPHEWSVGYLLLGRLKYQWFQLGMISMDFVFRIDSHEYGVFLL